jgi:ubiquinone/menaquinone biosynthesis C-methylase UbiE
MLWERVFAAIYDRLQAPAERDWLGRRRSALLAPLSGRVLEIGGGTGANLRHYPPAVACVTLSEPSAPMRDRIGPKLAAAAVPVEVVDAAAESLPFADGEFDHVVATLVLCTVGDVAASLAEVRRVLKPGGTLRFIEHGGDAPGRKGAWQHRLDPIYTRIACGCHLTRSAPRNIEAAGFRLVECEQFDPPGVPPLLAPFVQGVAA